MGIFPQIARAALGQLLPLGTVTEESIKLWHQVIDACFLFGAALGGLLFGWLGDRIGRVRAMAFSILVYSGFTGLLYFVGAAWHIAVLRFVAAIGMGGEWALGVALVMEIWDAKHRPILAGLIGAAANVGFVLVGLMGYLIRVNQDNWRYIALMGAAPALLTFVIRLFVPESRRWQETQKVAKSRPLTELFGDRRLAWTTVMAITFASVALLGTWGAVQKIPAWVPTLPGATATAQGISYNFGRIFAGVGGIVLGGTVPGGYATMGAAVSLIYVVGMLVIWVAPETKGRPLPD
jgi:MFS family permease